jgi:cell division protease FtsH
MGPPGTGKTLLAKAVAGEAKVPFFSASGSEFVEMFVGVGAARVRDLFEQAKKAAPAIIFVDELDAVGRHRFAGIGGGHDEREQTLNQILIELDGFEEKDGIILIGATNKPESLDAALVRPGRFDRRVVVPLPTVKDREAILKVHAKDVKTDPGVDLKVIARQTPGFAGSDLANAVNEAAILAVRRNKELTGQSEFEEAVNRAAAGPARKSAVLSPKEKKIVAYHEAGHTLAAKLLSGTDPVHRVTIVSHGQSLGHTLQLPEEDRHLNSKKELLLRLQVLLGGRAAEEIVFGGENVTGGAADDLAKAKRIAEGMIAKLGMGEDLLVVSDDAAPQNRLLGGSDMPPCSQKRMQEIETEAKELIRKAKEEVVALLSQNRKKLDALAEKLLEKETLSGEEVHRILEST